VINKQLQVIRALQILVMVIAHVWQYLQHNLVVCVVLDMEELYVEVFLINVVVKMEELVYQLLLILLHQMNADVQQVLGIIGKSFRLIKINLKILVFLRGNLCQFRITTFQSCQISGCRNGGYCTIFSTCLCPPNFRGTIDNLKKSQLEFKMILI
jgi:hypothetical protein